MFCRSCEAAHSTQVCGVSASFCAELLDEARFADAGLADDLDELTLACQSARPAARQQRKLVLAADERRQGARPAPPAGAARPDNAVERDGDRHALEVMCASVLDDEKPGRLPLHARGNEHRPRFGRGLHARRDVRRLAEHFARGVDHDRAALDADAGGKLGRARLGVAGVEVGERALDRERRAHGAFGVVLLRLRIAKKGHQPIAELLQHMAAEPRHRARGLVEIGPDQVAPVLRVELGREARRADEIAEHHRNRAALRRYLKTLARRGLGRGGKRVRRRRWARQGGDCGEQPAPIADR